LTCIHRRITDNSKRANKLHKQIHKTALDAETIIKWEHTSDIEALLANLAESGFEIIGLEQNTESIKLPDYTPSDKVAIVVGREVEGIESELLDKCDKVVEIPMFGKKESFNVVQAAAMTLYHCTFYPF
jgi:tRNA G18 (ribose-2'-O)-methylase SpoU